MVFVLICYNVPRFLCRMGFSAEQLARWVAERTDVNVCGLFFCIHFGRDLLQMFFHLTLSFTLKKMLHHKRNLKKV